MLILSTLYAHFHTVNAFWSVTVYYGKTKLSNSINRYLINSLMLTRMKKRKDGSLTIYIQRNAPPADKKSNWLPECQMVLFLWLCACTGRKKLTVDSSCGFRNVESIGGTGCSVARVARYSRETLEAPM